MFYYFIIFRKRQHLTNKDYKGLESCIYLIFIYVDNNIHINKKITQEYKQFPKSLGSC